MLVSVLYERKVTAGLYTPLQVTVLYLNLFQTLKYNLLIIFQAALGPEVYSASNRNEYQTHKNNNVSGE
jgi:hypothetical protein